MGRKIALASLCTAIVLFTLGLFVVAPARAEHRSDVSYYRDRAERFERAYDELERTLRQVDRLSGHHTGDHRLHMRIERAIEAGRDRAMDALEGDDEGRGDDHRSSIEREDAVMSPSDFAQLLEAVRTAAFSDTQLLLVRSAATTSSFTVDQVVALVRAVSFSDTQVEVAAMLHPRCADLRGWYRVYAALSFERSRSELRARLGE